jgi:hypothetical protein
MTRLISYDSVSISTAAHARSERHERSYEALSRRGEVCSGWEGYDGRDKMGQQGASKGWFGL